MGFHISMAYSRVHRCLPFLLLCALLIPNTGANLATTSEECGEFTISKCTEGHHDRTTTHDEAVCQSICFNLGYDYYKLDNTIEIQGCWLHHGSFHNYMSSCQYIGGPREPLIANCLELTDPCKVLYINQNK